MKGRKKRRPLGEGQVGRKQRVLRNIRDKEWQEDLTDVDRALEGEDYWTVSPDAEEAAEDRQGAP
ncbi:MAG: hypothetical protein WAW06_06255 [bacterium]